MIFLAFIHIKTTANILTKCKEDHRSCKRIFCGCESKPEFFQAFFWQLQKWRL